MNGLPGAENNADFLSRDRFAVNRTEPAEVEQARNPFGIPTVRLDRHYFQRSFHLPRFHENRIKASFSQPSMQPFRQWLSLQADCRDAAVQIIEPARQNLGFALSLCLFSSSI